MSNWSILPLLPFRYVDEGKNRELLAKVREICGTERYALYLLEKPEFRPVYEQEGFDICYSELSRLLAITLTQKKLIGSTVGEDTIFIGICHNLFEKFTERKTTDNSMAFRLFLSFMRRKDNEVKWLAARKAESRKKPRSKRVNDQPSLFR